MHPRTTQKRTNPSHVVSTEFPLQHMSALHSEQDRWFSFLSRRPIANPTEEELIFANYTNAWEE
ncbi:unnamed protein product [Arabis nemorensis]|uniref:Uncharacterized protein n=1 Tax=Arabis nemorensis TaxID=586526 RepID=A0A565BBV0_9BRAS|nr:unnamed protein product [Arabis nemorensis]